MRDKLYYIFLVLTKKLNISKNNCMLFAFVQGYKNSCAHVQKIIATGA
jgi:hypothetical protein